MTTEAYPLTWPNGRDRTSPRRRERSRFKTTIGLARDSLLAELRLLGARSIVLSTNIRLRNDGLPYASDRPPEDPGVAVYFMHKLRQVCFACDRWDRVQDNLQAVNHTISALRGITRWGTGDMMEAAFRGFTPLPSPVSTRSWKNTLHFGETEWVTEQSLNARWKKLRSENHPDKGGDDHVFADMKDAYEKGCASLGVVP